MLPVAIDCGDQLRKGHATLAGNLLQTVPELVFKADARLVACNDNRALRNRRLHSFSPPQMSHRNQPRSWRNATRKAIADRMISSAAIASTITQVLSSSMLANEANSLNLWP